MPKIIRCILINGGCRVRNGVMRTLAHYTVFEGRVYHLHVFDFSESGISHFPVVEETVDTLFVEGILVACCRISRQELSELNAWVSGKRALSLYDLAAAVAGRFQDSGRADFPSGFPTLLQLRYPEFYFQEI